MAEKSLVKIIVDSNNPNKAWITEEMMELQTEPVKEFLIFMRHNPTLEKPTTFAISLLEPSDARDLEDIFKSYRDSLELPNWLQIKIE